MFAPIVLAFRQLMGDAQFIKVRGQAIALHAQAIIRFCEQF